MRFSFKKGFVKEVERVKGNAMLGDKREKRVRRVVEKCGGEKAACGGDKSSGSTMSFFSRNESIFRKNPTRDFNFSLYSWVGMNIQSVEIPIGFIPIKIAFPQRGKV